MYREKDLEYKNKKYKESSKYRIDARLRRFVSETIRLKKKRPFLVRNSKYEDILGFSCSELLKEIEDKFSSGMSWSNYGEWQVDHIIPLSSFKYSSVFEKNVKKCWALSNIQPLWKKDNLKKGNKG